MIGVPRLETPADYESVLAVVEQMKKTEAQLQDPEAKRYVGDVRAMFQAALDQYEAEHGRPD